MGLRTLGLAGWLGAIWIVGGCAPLLELPRPPAVAGPAQAPVLVFAYAPAPEAEPAGVALMGPSDGPVNRGEETVALFDPTPLSEPLRELATEKPAKKKKRGKATDDPERED